jgi:acyl-CoA synthetase (NDP forming)
LFYSCKDQLSYQEADKKLTSLLSGYLPPVGSVGNPIEISDDSDDNDDIKSLLSHPNYREV